MQDKNEGEIQVYELGYHLLPSMSEESVLEEVSKIQSLISSKGGSMISESLPSLKQLAYDIEKKIETKNFKFNKAFFGWVKFELEPGKIGEIDGAMTADQNVLRFIIIKTVRENTLFTPKAPVFKKEIPVAAEGVEGKVEVAPVSEEEIDKSIDELLVDEKIES